jgi:hypothetical protein
VWSKPFARTGAWSEKPALHLVGDRKRGQQIAAGASGELGGRQHGGEVVTRMAGLAGCEVGIVEVEVADERPVVEGRTIGRAPAATDERAERRAAELLGVGADGEHRLRPERADRAAERVEHAQLQLLARFARELLERGALGEGGEPLDRGRIRAARHRYARSAGPRTSHVAIAHSRAVEVGCEICSSSSPAFFSVASSATSA